MLAKYIKFCVVGATGALITWSLTYSLTEFGGWWYMASAVTATLIAMTWNFMWNLKWTFKEQRTPETPDYEWHAFYNGSIIQRWWKQSLAKIVWDWIPNASDIINVGCGSSPIATQYPNAENIDVDEKKLAYMRTKTRGNFHYGDAMRIPYEDGIFDHAICIEVIEHVTQPEKALAEIARVLKPGGNLVIATPDYAKRRWHLAEMFTPYKEWHGSKLTKSALEALARNAGFELKRFQYVAGCDLVEEFVKA